MKSIPFNIMSENAKRIMKEKDKLTSFNYATLVWNAPGIDLNKKLKALAVMGAYTDDSILAEQITMRLAYEAEALNRFYTNTDNQYVYVVFTDNMADGYFKNYTDAYKYGIRMCEKYEGIDRFSIEKQLVYCEENKKMINDPYISKRTREFDLVFPNLSEYEARENASAYYNAIGDMLCFYSNEMSNEENEKVDDSDRSRFEFQFFKIPSVIEAGTIAKVLNEDMYVVVDGCMSTWDEYMEKANPSYYDFSDIQNPVHELNDSGNWHHHHINPLYLEPCLPEVSDEKSEIYVDALKKMSAYIRNMTPENDKAALDASKHYAEICDKCKVFHANSIELVMW